MNLDTRWELAIAELDGYVREAGVEPVAAGGAQFARDLDPSARAALVSSLREVVRQARVNAPPVEHWLTASQDLFMGDDGTAAALERAEQFWGRLTHIVNGCLALVMLGDLSEFPFFVELLKVRPAGHLIEMSTEVLRHYVDPARELDAPRLVQRAEEWFQTRQAFPADGPPRDVNDP
jgi:hypothetical protein